MPDSDRYRFGPFLLEPAIRRLLHDSAEITLPPKAFDILVLLVRARDRVLSKQELLDAVWPDTAVTENTLTQRIKEIREALEDDAQEPRYVRTGPTYLRTKSRNERSRCRHSRPSGSRWIW